MDVEGGMPSRGIEVQQTARHRAAGAVNQHVDRQETVNRLLDGADGVFRPPHVANHDQALPAKRFHLQLRGPGRVVIVAADDG